MSRSYNNDDYYDDDDDEDEDVGLLKANTLDQEDRNGAYNSRLTMEARKKKVQQYLFKQQQGLFTTFSERKKIMASFQSNGDDAENENNKKNFNENSICNFSCRVGCVMVFISIALGIWMWSTQQVQLYSGMSQNYEWNDIRIDDIKSWCLDKSSLRCFDSCSSDNPLIGRHRSKHKHWEEAFFGNVREALIASEMRHVDVVFYGDSIIEGWKGFKLGQLHPYKLENAAVFQHYFGHKDNKL